MAIKKSSQKDSSHVLIVISILVLVLALGVTIWRNLNISEINPTPSRDTRPNIENVLTLEGTVTLIQSSCGAKSIYPDEDTRTPCDSGKAIRVDKKKIYTSTGGPGPGFSVNTDFVNLGDTVLVKYVVDKDYGEASLDCDECSVTVTKSSNLQK
jgi:hypothetical protein